MPATYSGDPSESNKDEVRYLVGDTGGSEFDERGEFFLSDAEVRYAVSNAGNNKQAALACAKRIKNRLAKEADADVGDGSVDFSQRFDNIGEVIEELEKEVSLEGLNPYAGGISESDKDTVEDDNDRVEPFFVRGQFDSFRTFGPSRRDENDEYHHH
jgi:hypothetical protein